MIGLRKKPTINGDRVILRPFYESDLTLVEEILTEKEAIRLTGSKDNFDTKFVRKWYLSRNEQTDRLDLAIEDKKLNELVGEVVVNEYNEKDHSMNFRILIGKRGRNRGLGTEATQLICDYIFTDADLNLLTLSVFAFNPRAQHVYEKVGFLVNSIDENELEHDGEWIDSINMKLTRETWERK